jgi:hypothetical protein
MKTLICLATVITTLIGSFMTQLVRSQVIIVPRASDRGANPINVPPIVPPIFINPTTDRFPPNGIYPYTSDFPGSKNRIYLNSRPLRQPSFNHWQPVDIFQQQNTNPPLLPYTCNNSIGGNSTASPIGMIRANDTSCP